MGLQLLSLSFGNSNNKKSHKKSFPPLPPALFDIYKGGWLDVGEETQLFTEVLTRKVCVWYIFMSKTIN